jgi:hypothetical protein
MLQSKEWPIVKIFQLAKVHVKLCQNYRVIYIQNVQDIRNAVGENGHTILRGFLGMTYMKSTRDKVQLIHSIHNTRRKNIKAVLVPHEHYDLAIVQFGALHQCLLAGIEGKYHKNVFIEGLEAGMTGGQRDMIHSCNSSNNASELLILYYPQDGEVDSCSPTQKRFCPTVLSFATSVKSSGKTASASSSDVPHSVTQQSTSVSSLTDADLDRLYDRLKHPVVSTNPSSQGISVEEI